MADRNIMRFVRDQLGGMEHGEVIVRSMLQRGYTLNQLALLYAPENSAHKLLGQAAEANIRRSVRRTRRLPCGEAVRVVNSKSPESVAKYEHDCWLDFQFNTGTHGDQLVGGPAGGRSELPW